MCLDSVAIAWLVISLLLTAGLDCALAPEGGRNISVSAYPSLIAEVLKVDSRDPFVPL